MQDTFARARARPKGHAAARPSARAKIGYIVYNKRGGGLKIRDFDGRPYVNGPISLTQAQLKLVCKIPLLVAQR